MDVQSIRGWAVSAGINPRTAQRAAKRLQVGTPICGGKVVVLTREEWKSIETALTVKRDP